MALASGGGRTEFGAYENHYAFVYTVRDGTIASVLEYLDTAEVETKVFG